MTTLNQGRNEIRFNNSGGRCLLENWVEERAVDQIDPQDLNEDVASSAKVFKYGHSGLLTTNFGHCPEKLTTFTDSYRPPAGPRVRQTGAKAELLEKMLYAQVSQEVDGEFHPPASPEPIESVTHEDFNIIGFEPSKPVPTGHHDYVNDQACSFWTEHREVLHGVSQIKPTFNSAFRKNTAFSKPIEEYWDQSKPHEFENVPNM